MSGTTYDVLGLICVVVGILWLAGGGPLVLALLLIIAGLAMLIYM